MTFLFVFPIYTQAISLTISILGRLICRQNGQDVSFLAVSHLICGQVGGLAQDLQQAFI